MIYADIRKGDWAIIWGWPYVRFRSGIVINPNETGRDRPSKNYLALQIPNEKEYPYSNFWKHRLYGILRDGIFHYIPADIDGPEYYGKDSGCP